MTLFQRLGTPRFLRATPYLFDAHMHPSRDTSPPVGPYIITSHLTVIYEDKNQSFCLFYCSMVVKEMNNRRKKKVLYLLKNVMLQSSSPSEHRLYDQIVTPGSTFNVPGVWMFRIENKHQFSF